jgi:hypothetical protein
VSEAFHLSGDLLAYLYLPPNEEEFLWRAADTKTVLNGTAALTSMEF